MVEVTQMFLQCILLPNPVPTLDSYQLLVEICWTMLVFLFLNMHAQK